MIGNACIQYLLLPSLGFPILSRFQSDSGTQEIPGNDAAGPVPSPRVSFTDAGQISGSTRIYHPQKKNIPEHIYLGSYFHHKRYKRFWKCTVFHIFAFFLNDRFFLHIFLFTWHDGLSFKPIWHGCPNSSFHSDSMFRRCPNSISGTHFSDLFAFLWKIQIFLRIPCSRKAVKVCTNNLFKLN